MTLDGQFASVHWGLSCIVAKNDHFCNTLNHFAYTSRYGTIASKADRDMSIFLYVIPLLALFSGIYIYRHNGKFELFNLDLVQFFYMFLLAPLFFVWSKSFIYVLLQAELGDRISSTQIFVVDTAFTVAMMYIYAFLVMHSLTKTFRLKSEQNPRYDLFEHSEYIHLWLSHIVIVIGLMTLFFMLSVANVFFPVQWVLQEALFILLIVGGVVTGVVTYVGIALTDPKQEGRRYMRLMKLAIGCFFLLMMAVYFVWSPPFNSFHGMYWFMFFLFTALFICALLTFRSSTVSSWFARLADANKDTDFWGVNMQLFPKPGQKKK